MRYQVGFVKSLRNGKSMLGEIVVSCILSMSAPKESAAFPVCAKLGPGQSLLKLAAYYGPIDNRKLISEGGKSLGLSDQEITHLREVTGAMICLGPNGKGFAYSATLEGNGDRILTAAHNLNQNEKNSIHFDKCYFQNESIPQKKSPIALNVNRLPDAKFSSGWPQDSTADYAVIKLEKPLSIKNPFPFDPTGKHLSPEDKIIVVSGAQRGFNNHEASEPIVQQCSAPDSMVVSTTIYYTNCALFHQASGSIGYYRDSKGILNQKTIANAVGTENVSEEYDHTKGQYSVVQGLDRTFLMDASRLGISLNSKQAQN